MNISDFMSLSEKDAAVIIGNLAHEDMQKSGILASITAAQFILESGYGKTELAQKANNCFGMKTFLSNRTKRTGSRLPRSTGLKKKMLGISL